RILSGDDGFEVGRQPLSFENATDFNAERSGCDGERLRPSRTVDGCLGAGEQDRAMGFGILHTHGLCPHVRVDVVRGPWKAAVDPYGLEHADIVVAEIARVIALLGEIDTNGGEHVTERAEVQRFAVGNHAVEVEDDGSKGHVYVFGRFRRSPAWTGNG